MWLFYNPLSNVYNDGICEETGVSRVLLELLRITEITPAEMRTGTYPIQNKRITAVPICLIAFLLSAE
jgi:hypothetical protein